MRTQLKKTLTKRARELLTPELDAIAKMVAVRSEVKEVELTGALDKSAKGEAKIAQLLQELEEAIAVKEESEEEMKRVVARCEAKQRHVCIECTTSLGHDPDLTVEIVPRASNITGAKGPKWQSRRLRERAQRLRPSWPELTRRWPSWRRSTQKYRKSGR